MLDFLTQHRYGKKQSKGNWRVLGITNLIKSMRREGLTEVTLEFKIVVEIEFFLHL